MSEDLKAESAISTPSAETVVKDVPIEAPAKEEKAEAISMMTGSKEGTAEEVPASKVSEDVKVEIKVSDLKLPDNSALDPKVVDEVVSFAKEQNLTQAQAQAILERENKAYAAYEQVQKDKLEEISNGRWQKEMQEDKEIGGEKFKENVDLAFKAFSKFSTPEFTEIMRSTGLGNHPELNRVFLRIGKAMGNDKILFPEPTQPKPSSIPDRLYRKNEPSDGGTKP